MMYEGGRERWSYCKKVKWIIPIEIGKALYCLRPTKGAPYAALYQWRSISMINEQHLRWHEHLVRNLDRFTKCTTPNVPHKFGHITQWVILNILWKNLLGSEILDIFIPRKFDLTLSAMNWTLLSSRTCSGLATVTYASLTQLLSRTFRNSLLMK